MALGVAGCAGTGRKTYHPLTVWGADLRQEVLPTARGPVAGDPVYDPAKGDINLCGAVNETVAFQLALHSGVAPVKAVDVHVGSLRNDAGQDLRATIKVYRAQTVQVSAFHPWQRLYRNEPCTPRQVFDVLVPAESTTAGLPVDMPIDSMALAWIDVHIDKGSEPGRYTGAVKILSQGQELWTVNVSLQVRAVALPDEPAMPAIVRFDARQLCRMHLTLAGRPYAPVRLTDKDPLSDKAIELIQSTARMLDEHGIVGVPTGYEPAMHVDDCGTVQMEWEDYDRLVQPLVDGSAFAARIQPAAWPVPLDADHPPMPGNGPAKMTTYENMLRQMVRQSAEHFRLRRWDRQAYVEINPSGTWPDEYVRWQRQIAPILRSGDQQIARLLRLPAEELGAYGWYGWPKTQDLAAGANLLSMPGRFYLYQAGQEEPGARGQERRSSSAGEMTAMQGLRSATDPRLPPPGSRKMWLRPDYPPYCPSLQVGAGPLDPAAVAWAAWRLRADALDLPTQKDWPDSQPVNIDRLDQPSDAWLIWPGAPWGVDGPVPSIRLKRLRAGLEECEYLHLLRQHGRIHVDELLAESLVPLAGSLAYGRQYCEGLDGEMQLDPALWKAGLDLMAEELDMALTGAGSDEFDTFTNRIAWQTFLGRTRQVRAWAEPARLAAQEDGTLRIQVPVEVLNLKTEPIRGTLRWGSMMEGWHAQKDKIEFGPIQPFQRTRVTMVAKGPGIGVNAAGHSSWSVVLEPQTGKEMDIPVLVSAVAVMPLAKPIHVDGDLTDWPTGRFNQMSDFRLLGSGKDAGKVDSLEGRQTYAFVASDGKMLYIAARMQDQSSQMRMSQRNTVQYDDGSPVGEDLIEILIDPDNGEGGGPERLIHIIVKSNGAAVANLGVDMWPPVCRPLPLGTRVTAATRVYQDAWTAEVAIPLTAVKAVRPKAAYWGLGICRLRAGNLEYSSWAGARMSSYHPSSLGNVLVGGN